MKLLNLSCGSNRHGDPWTNLDFLFAQFPASTPEGRQLLSEPNYVDHDIRDTLPFEAYTFDGILASHIIEHFDCHEAVRILKECYRILTAKGLLVVSVPDAEYFLSVMDQDTPENAIHLFGEPIHDSWQPSFFHYALFHREHKQILTPESLRCLLFAAGFTVPASSMVWARSIKLVGPTQLPIVEAIEPLLNRRKFSVEMLGLKD